MSASSPVDAGFPRGPLEFRRHLSSTPVLMKVSRSDTVRGYLSSEDVSDGDSSSEDRHEKEKQANNNDEELELVKGAKASQDCGSQKKSF